MVPHSVRWFVNYNLGANCMDFVSLLHVQMQIQESEILQWSCVMVTAFQGLLVPSYLLQVSSPITSL